MTMPTYREWYNLLRGFEGLGVFEQLGGKNHDEFYCGDMRKLWVILKVMHALNENRPEQLDKPPADAEMHTGICYGFSHMLFQHEVIYAVPMESLPEGCISQNIMNAMMEFKVSEMVDVMSQQIFAVEFPN